MDAIWLIFSSPLIARRADLAFLSSEYCFLKFGIYTIVPAPYIPVQIFKTIIILNVSVHEPLIYHEEVSAEARAIKRALEPIKNNEDKRKLCEVYSQSPMMLPGERFTQPQLGRCF
jgi:hypothetical protein